MTLLAAWDYSGAGAVIPDMSGNGRDFSLTGTSARTAAGGGYTYGGTRPLTRGLGQGTTEVQDGPPITGLNTAARTVMTWAKTAPVNPSWFLEYHRNAEDTGVFGWLFLSSVLRGRAKNAANAVFEVSTVTDSPNYHHRALTHDGATLRLYHDGVLVGSAAMASAVWAADTLRIFTNAGSGVVLSETRIFDEALDAATITTWMNTPIEVPSVTLATATETGSAHPMTWSKSPELATATETGTAHPMTWSKSPELATATETGVAHPMTWAKQPALDTAGETSVAHPMSWAKAALLATATETGVAHPMTWTKRPVFGVTAETGVAHPMTFDAGGAYFPVTDPAAVIRPNPASATVRPNPAKASI